ncbi:MAG TPA: glycoside hydrolase family 3 C-terminal domain-containing protein [Bryobacteraceae bacterium]|nr:glycoside hydrolase family 3 C-terminal domain-containing protein [Bryobacteraceae bacterium]
MLTKSIQRLSHVVLAAALCAWLSPPAPAQFGPRRPKPTGPWMNKSLSPDQRADLLVAQLTLDEKISLLHGGGWMMLFAVGPDAPPSKSLGNAGYIPGIPRLGIPDLQMADAAVGVTHSSVFGRYSTALPSGEAEAATWDLEMAREYGALIGRELRNQGYTMSLGGGVNLVREPRNGRIFEYKGEDPILAGRLVGAEMKALQEQGVLGDIKHYALNDQESGRNYINVKVDKRAMRESDLLAFEIGVKESGAGAVMCSYNLLNGDYACENSYLLTEVLKKDFGFEGFVVSDWGGTHSTAKAALAGLDMEMPTNTYFAGALKKAVESGEVPAARLDNMVHRILRAEIAVGLFDRPLDTVVPDVLHGLDVAQRVAQNSIVLLKNAGEQLPLSAARVKTIAVIGSHADVGVLSGGGSAQVDPMGGNPVPQPKNLGIFDQVVWHRSAPLKAIRARAPHADVQFDPGTDSAAAARLAKASDVAIVFVSQPSSEGKDHPNLSLPDNQDALVSAVAAANPHTVVVLETGGPVTMPWIGQVSAAMEAWYPGIRGAEAIAGVLFGDVNPSAKLPLTFAMSEADLPRPAGTPQPPPASDKDIVEIFPGYKDNRRRFDVSYDEGPKVGYKWFDAEKKEPLYPFGFGLSYTTYKYSGLKVAKDTVTFNVANAGSRAGAEVTEVYATLPQAAGEPFKRLVAWEKVTLAPGESKTLTLPLQAFYLSIFNADKDAWELAPGEYVIQAGGSSRDLPLRGSMHIK